MAEALSILILEDDPVTGKTLVSALKKEGHEVEWKKDGKEGLTTALDRNFDLIILDVNLPGMNGFAVLAALRSADVASTIFMLTAESGPPKRLKGLVGGADEYLTKPFDIREIKIRAQRLKQKRAISPDLLTVGDITINRVTHDVERAGEPVHLSEREFELLYYLMRRAGKVVTKKDILRDVWRSDFERDPNVVNVYMTYLRKKLERKDLPSPIETILGQGVKFIKA